MNATPETHCSRLPRVTCEFADTCGSVALGELLENTNVSPCIRDMLAAINPQPQEGQF